MLIKLWFKLIGGCDHTYEIYKQYEASYTLGGTQQEYHCRCTKCSKMKFYSY